VTDRISRDEWGLRLAEATGSRGTCRRRWVGAVLTDAAGVVLSTGYNGTPRGWDHCTDVPCGGEGFASGAGLDECEAIHAEVNAVVSCPDPARIHTVYLTVSPCVPCVKMLLATRARRIVYRYGYPAPRAEELWLRAGREWKELPGG
jgi:dCMP deaminase